MSGRGDHIRSLLPEVALGVISGEERTEALEHLAGCPGCRRELDQLTEVSDALLALAPGAEPAPGFEARVLARMSPGGTTRPRPRWRRAVAAVAAAAVGAGVALGAGFLATGEQREFASSYRRALEQAEGSYFGGLPLVGPEGKPAGHVFGYEGSPPWVFVMLTSAGGSATYDVAVETQGGRKVPLGSFEAVDGRGSFGATLSVELLEVAVLRVEERGGPAVFTAEAPPPEE